jgi:hypothetical protein
VAAQGYCVGGVQGISCHPLGSTATINNSVLANNHAFGASATGSALTVFGSVVADTQPQPFDQNFGIGVSAQVSCIALPGGLLCDPDQRGSLSLASSLVERQRYVGVVVAGSDGVITESIIRDTLPHPVTGLFGDGVVVTATGGVATIALDTVRVANSARAGVASFGATGEMARSEIACAAIPLDVEEDDGVLGVIADGGDNRCGCDDDGAELGECKAVSSSLAPPIVGTGSAVTNDE